VIFKPAFATAHSLGRLVQSSLKSMENLQQVSRALAKAFLEHVKMKAFLVFTVAFLNLNK